MKIPPELGLPRNAIVLGDLQQLVRLISEENTSTAKRKKIGGTVGADKTNDILLKLAQHLAALATTAWKMQRRIVDAETQEPKASLGEGDTRKLFRDLQTFLGTLTDMGITIRDRAGEPFDYGMPEKVVDAKSEPGITKERVAETLRPTVTWTTEFWQNTMIQKGEVIIHTPEA
jgi:hypothetical protein